MIGPGGCEKNLSGQNQQRHSGTSNVYTSSRTDCAYDLQRQIRAETELAEQRKVIEHAESVHRSMLLPYPFGKDCSRRQCHPYIVAVKDVLWGFTEDEPIHSETIWKYEEANKRALRNVRSNQEQFSMSLPEVPNLASGLPKPYSFTANNFLLSRLSANERPYLIFPYISDPNPKKPKHGRIVWECQDLQGEVVASRVNDFKQKNRVVLSCNDIATKFAEADAAYKSY